MGTRNKLPGVDEVAGLSNLQGNRQMFERLLQKFSENNQDTIEKIKDMVAHDDWTAAQRVVHTLKGLAGTLGMTNLQKLSQEVEREMIARNAQELNRGVQRLAPELEMILKSIQKSVPPKERTRRDQKPPTLGSSLEALERSLRDGNPEAQHQWSQIGNIPGHEEEGKVLGRAIGVYQFDKALTVLRSIRAHVDRTKGGDP